MSEATILAEVRARADELEGLADRAETSNSKIALLLACLELNKLADFIEGSLDHG